MVVNTIGHIAEAAWHHPDLTVSYAFVIVKLQNHAAKGITEKDFLLAQEIERIILVEVPTKIYGEIRGIFISLFENSGFKDVKISKSVDFEKLYNTKKIQ